MEIKNITFFFLSLKKRAVSPTRSTHECRTHDHVNVVVHEFSYGCKKPLVFDAEVVMKY